MAPSRKRPQPAHLEPHRPVARSVPWLAGRSTPSLRTARSSRSSAPAAPACRARRSRTRHRTAPSLRSRPPRSPCCGGAGARPPRCEARAVPTRATGAAREERRRRRGGRARPRGERDPDRRRRRARRTGASGRSQRSLQRVGEPRETAARPRLHGAERRSAGTRRSRSERGRRSTRDRSPLVRAPEALRARGAPARRSTTPPPPPRASRPRTRPREGRQRSVQVACGASRRSCCGRSCRARHRRDRVPRS